MSYVIYLNLATRSDSGTLFITRDSSSPLVN